LNQFLTGDKTGPNKRPNKAKRYRQNPCLFISHLKPRLTPLLKLIKFLLFVSTS